VDAAAAAAAPYAKPPESKSPPLPLASYVGTYHNDYIGDVRIVAQSDTLRMLVGPGRTAYDLEHWNRDQFVYTAAAEFPGFRAGVFFTIGADQTANQILIEHLNGAGLGTLTRVRPR
jgi:hypothetical protein